MTLRIVGSVVAFSAAALVASCTPPQDRADPRPDARSTAQFSAEDKIAAQALSIGNTVTLEGATDPYQLAMTCSVAVESLGATLQKSANLNAPQIRAMKQITSVYASRVRTLGAANGKTSADVKTDLTRLRSADNDPAEQARTAIGCIQRLQ